MRFSSAKPRRPGRAFSPIGRKGTRRRATSRPNGPICPECRPRASTCCGSATIGLAASRSPAARSEEHTSELQSQFHLVCRLLLEKKKKNIYPLLLIKKKKKKKKKRKTKQHT